MAFLKRVALLNHPQHCILLFHNLTSGHEAVMQAVGRVFASTCSDSLSESTGPVRYTQKPLPNKGPDDGRRCAFQLGDAHNLGPGSWDEEENSGRSKPFSRRGNPKTSRGRGQKGLSASSYSSPASNSMPTTRTNHISKGEVEQEGGQDITQSELDAGEYLFGNSNGLNAQEEDVQVGKARRGQTTHEDPSTSARNYVMGLLARGLQTEFNLRSKLTRRSIPLQVIDNTIHDLQRCGLQSDKEYAEAFARSRWTDNTWGPMRIKYELSRRGIQKETIEAALVKVFETLDTIDGDQDEEGGFGNWGMTGEAAQHLINQARRRWSLGDVEIDVRRKRMMGWLQRRGFPWPVVSDIIQIIQNRQAP